MKSCADKQICDYNCFRLSGKQFALGLLEGLILCAGAAFLFYRSPLGMALAGILAPLYLHRKKIRYTQERKRRLLQHFKSGMQAVSGALAAGYSMENAWRNAEVDLKKLYGESSEFYQELSRMNQKIRMNEPLEKVLAEFALRSGSEDICNFAEIFRYAKRSGGNITAIIRITIERMQEKADIMAEIENAVAAKKAEQKMMNIMLPGILAFVTFSSPEYVSVLYGTPLGVVVMSICLAGYLAACQWSEKLTNISV